MNFLWGRAWYVVIAILLTGPAVATLQAKEKQEVTIRYLLGPSEPLPEGLDTVAVLDAAVQTRGMQQDDRERKWSTIAADMIESMLHNNAGKADPSLTVANRRVTREILAEKDLKLAGLVEGEQATQAAKLLDVQGLITSQINIQVDVNRSKKTTIDFGSVLSGALSGGGRGGARSFRTKEVEEISRNMTVQCTFGLIDAATGQVLLQHATPPVHKQDTASPDFFMGTFAKEDDLDPVDYFIGELVERATTEFVSKLVPVQVRTTVLLVGRDDAGEAAVRALRGDDYERALNLFLEAFQEDDEEFDTVFAIAATSELLGMPEQALKRYREAASMRKADEEEVEQARVQINRLNSHLPRIVRAKKAEPAAVEPERTE